VKTLPPEQPCAACVAEGFLPGVPTYLVSRGEFWWICWHHSRRWKASENWTPILEWAARTGPPEGDDALME